MISLRTTSARLTALLGTVILLSFAARAHGRQASAAQTTGSKAQTAALTGGTAAAVAAPSAKPKSPAERLHSALLSFPPLPFHPATIVIDPSHGGSDNGSRISDTIVEKDVTLALALRLRSLLTARGFNVVLTRADDKATNPTPPFVPLSLDDRAGIANHERPSACLLIHATGAGTGVHLYTSELAPTAGELPAAPWLRLQAPWVRDSQALASRIGDALNRSGLPLVNGSASVRPLDSLTCPALVLELAPRTGSADTINDDGYQQTVAQAAANALILWKEHVQAPPRLTPDAPAGSSGASAQ